MRSPDDFDPVGEPDAGMRERPAVFIGVVAEITRVHPQTLRHYERIGLVTPGRSRGNVRLYSQEDIERVRLIQRLTHELGVNLAGVEVILNMRETHERQRQESERREQRLGDRHQLEIERLQAEIDRLRAALRRLVG